ncbi:MAG: GGDEF domain-containing protein, partial [Thermoanaerobaculia bacterium]|nr:GGDEF domain-containing protein [Thermoanaerobaculia bacterium]
IAGLVTAYRYGEPFTSEDENLLTVVSSLLSLVLSNIRAQQKIQKLADQDELTGVGNKRSMRKRLAAEVERSRVYKVPLSVLMYDLDDFKEINDSYGHPMGDVVLSELCGAVRETLRPTDHLARFGGDEFTIVLPHTDLKGARATAERILEKVRGLRLMSDEGRMITISVSIGVASFLDSDSGPADLLQRADERLYDSKHGGKDRVSW